MIRLGEKKLAVGGTFSPLHSGHTYLLKKALNYGDEIIIGLTSDKMIDKDVKKFKKRKKNLIDFLDRQDLDSSYEIVKIEDKYGPAIKEKFDAIVISPETKKIAKEINQKRNKKDLKSLEIITADYILAEDWKPISSSKIRNGEINKKGKIIKNN